LLWSWYRRDRDAQFPTLPADHAEESDTRGDTDDDPDLHDDPELP
jgi:hypothetical protein